MKIKNSLNLFYDEKNVLRVKTRISGIENFSYDKKFPVLLKSDSYFTKLVILNLHNDVCHSGVDTTLNRIRSCFWIIKGRQTVKKVLRKCFICKYVQGKVIVPPQTPDLPKFRIQCNHSFENVRVDFAGPLYCKSDIGDMRKCYILLFTCSVTRATHLELTSGLGHKSLILALRRFIARRGQCKLIISDNFKTFKSSIVKNYLRNHNISWQFILERSPWWGGFYDRLIGLTKACIKKVIGKEKLTWEELETICTEVEGAINTRPLTQIDDDPNNNILTPNHLIYGRNIHEKCTDSGDFCEITHDEATSRLQHIIIIMKQFFKRFEIDYIQSLQERYFYTNNKKYENKSSASVGDIVLIKENNIPRMKWRKGKIIKLIHGKDGLVRGVEICIYQRELNKTTTIKRPVQLIVPFEIMDQHQNEPKKSPPELDLENSKKPKRSAARNADAIRRAMDI